MLNGVQGKSQSPISAIVGPGRSGTTWLGAIVDSSPEVIYRFEPFRRLAARAPEFRRLFDRLKRKEVGEGDLADVYSMLLPASPHTNKPPFFPDKSYALRMAGRRQLWPLARTMGPFERLYEALYSPPSGPPIVFKEVTFVRPLQNLMERTSVPLVYLIRHPCATVMSDVSGQVNGKMPSQRQLSLGEILAEHAPQMAAQFEHIVRGNDVIARTALLWRFEIESCVPPVEKSVKGMVLTYEQLADDPEAQVARVFAHLGLSVSSQTTLFIQGLLQLNTEHRRGPKRTGFADRYFSIYRNPRSEKDAWKAKISREDRRKIETIMEDSQVVANCARLGGWN